MISYPKKFHKTKNSKFPKIGNVILAGILLFLIGFLAFSNFKLYQKRKKVNLKVDILNQKIQKLEKETKKLKKELLAINNLDYLEKVAREKFNLKKPKEKVIVIKREVSFKKEKKEKKENNFFQNWLNWLKSKF